MYKAIRSKRVEKLKSSFIWNELKYRQSLTHWAVFEYQNKNKGKNIRPADSIAIGKVGYISEMSIMWAANPQKRTNLSVVQGEESFQASETPKKTNGQLIVDGYFTFAFLAINESAQRLQPFVWQFSTFHLE